MKYLLNLTGQELSNDMACSSSMEPFKLEEGSDEWFYDDCKMPLNDRINKIKNTIKLNKESIKGLIIKNNNFGITLFKEFHPEEKFAISIKRPNSNLHWYYKMIDSITDIMN